MGQAAAHAVPRRVGWHETCSTQESNTSNGRVILRRIFAVTAASVLAGCATTEPTIDSASVPAVVDSDGRVTTSEADRTLEDVANGAPDPEAFESLMNTIASLSNTPLYKDSHAKLLIDGPATYAKMLDAIDSASDYIHLETYIFADDQVGSRFRDALLRKRRQGVNVRIIFDSIGSMASSNAFFDEMQEAGIELIEFNSINPIDGGNPLNANVRDHRKLLIIDGRVAFTGGVNLSNTYSSSSRGRRNPDRLADGWRDTHVAIYGPAVQGFAKVFAHNWREQGGELDTLPAVPDDVDRSGTDVIAVLEAEGGDDVESSIFHAYQQAMRSARYRIWITQAYFAPDKEFLKDLRDAARRGIDVRLIVPGVTDSALVGNASRSRYGDLLKDGVKICERTSAVLHAKTAVIDGLWSTVGSSNLDYRSFLHNDEVNAIVVGLDFAQQMENQFIADLEDCRSITYEGWRNRPVFDRVKELFSWTIEYWL